MSVVAECCEVREDVQGGGGEGGQGGCGGRERTGDTLAEGEGRREERRGGLPGALSGSRETGAVSSGALGAAGYADMSREEEQVVSLTSVSELTLSFNFPLVGSFSSLGSQTQLERMLVSSVSAVMI